MESAHTVRFTPDGARLLAMNHMLTPPLYGGTSTPPALYEAATGKLLARLEDDREHKVDAFLTSTGSTSFAVLSPDGARVLTCSTNALASLWDSSTGERLLQLRGHRESVAWGAFSPDGKRVATAGDDVRLWDVATGKLVRVFRGHEGAVGLVAFSPDGTRLATSAADRTARVVEVATGRLLAALSLPLERSRSFVAFIDNDTLLTHSGGAMRLWPVDALGQAKRRKPRELTAAERQKYEINP
jgi:WD40 repeat protein